MGVGDLTPDGLGRWGNWDPSYFDSTKLSCKIRRFQGRISANDSVFEESALESSQDTVLNAFVF